MVYRGVVRNGVVMLEGGVELPDGTAVTVETLSARGVPRPPSAESVDADQRERVDRLLSVLHHSTDEAMEAQQRIDRFL